MHGHLEYTMLRQLSANEYDSTGKRPVALLMLTVEELETENSIRFEQDWDDLNELRWAAVPVDSGAAYAFVRHSDAGDGVQVFGDPSAVDLDELARALKIPVSLFIPARRAQ